MKQARTLREAITGFLARGANPEIADGYGWTPLMRAAEKGDISICQLLLESGAAIETRDGQGLDAVQWAARSSSLPCLHLLHGRGAKIDTADRQGRTALSNEMRDPWSREQAQEWAGPIPLPSTSPEGFSVHSAGTSSVPWPSCTLPRPARTTQATEGPNVEVRAWLLLGFDSVLSILSIMTAPGCIPAWRAQPPRSQ